MPDDHAPLLPSTDRQWDALGELRRLQDQHVTAGRGMGLHLATLKALEKIGLVALDESGTPDNRGRQWTAALTEAGQFALDQGDAEPTEP